MLATYWHTQTVGLGMLIFWQIYSDFNHYLDRPKCQRCCVSLEYDDRHCHLSLASVSSADRWIHYRHYSSL